MSDDKKVVSLLEHKKKKLNDSHSDNKLTSLEEVLTLGFGTEENISYCIFNDVYDLLSMFWGMENVLVSKKESELKNPSIPSYSLNFIFNRDLYHEILINIYDNPGDNMYKRNENYVSPKKIEFDTTDKSLFILKSTVTKIMEILSAKKLDYSTKLLSNGSYSIKVLNFKDYVIDIFLVEIKG